MYQDTQNSDVARQQRLGCFSNTTTFNDDLFTGACLAEARMTSRSHPCFLSYSARFTSSWYRTVFAVENNKRCACPVVVHPLKGGEQQRVDVARLLVRICGHENGTYQI